MIDDKKERYRIAYLERRFKQNQAKPPALFRKNMSLNQCLDIIANRYQDPRTGLRYDRRSLLAGVKWLRTRAKVLEYIRATKAYTPKTRARPLK